MACGCSAVPRARPSGPAQETRTRQVDRTDELYARPDAGQSTPDHTTQDAVRVTTYSMTHAARSDSLSLSLSLCVCVCAHWTGPWTQIAAGHISTAAP